MEKTKGSPYKNSDEQIAEKLSNLLSIISIIDSESKDYEKAYQICKIYKNAEAFRKAYGLILKFGKNDPMFNQYLEKIPQIYSQLLEYEKRDIIANVNYVINVEHYINNYKYAEFVIESFIASDHSYQMANFLEELGIDEEIFDYCLKTADELDQNLLDRYKQKKEEDKKNRYLANIYTFKNLANGIRTGFLFDGTPFDELEFWKRVPFKYSHGIKTEFDEYSKINPNIFFRADNFFGQIENFTQATIPAESKTILGYMKSNGIYGYRYLSAEQFKKLYSGQPIVVKSTAGIQVRIEKPEEALSKILYTSSDSLPSCESFGSEDADNVIKYMRINKLPSLTRVFTIVQQKYLNGEINMTEVNEQEQSNKARVLVP